MRPSIEIIDYQARWPEDFTAVGVMLRSALRDEALRIDHIGSTAIPGLGAKDIIDIQVTVARFDDVRHRAALESTGLHWNEAIRRDHCPPGITLDAAELEKRFAAGRVPRRTNVHVRVEHRFNQRYPLLCRDYLRSHPPAAAAYAHIKRALAGLFPNDEDSYYTVKDPVFDLIMAGANDWADATDWRPGVTDA
ncbi:MAG: GrpB family protein [Acidimicrobiia bacterium]